MAIQIFLAKEGGRSPGMSECTYSVWLMVVLFLLFLRMFCICESSSASTGGSSCLVESCVVTYWQQLLSYREDESDVWCLS